MSSKIIKLPLKPESKTNDHLERIFNNKENFNFKIVNKISDKTEESEAYILDKIIRDDNVIEWIIRVENLKIDKELLINTIEFGE